MSNNQKALPTYVLLILIPAVFGLLLYSLILKIDENHEIDNIKTKLSERAIDFTSKSSPVDYFKPHFQNLNQSLLPYIENQPGNYGPRQSAQDVTKIIIDLREKLNENIRVALFDFTGTIMNPENLLDTPEDLSKLLKNYLRIPNEDYLAKTPEYMLTEASIKEHKILQEISENTVLLEIKIKILQSIPKNLVDLPIEILSNAQNSLNKNPANLIEKLEEHQKALKDYQSFLNALFQKDNEDILKVIKFLIENHSDDFLYKNQDPLAYEIRFYQWAWHDIHGTLPNYIRKNYTYRRADQALIMGREFNDEVMYNQNEVCIPTNSLGKTGVFYFCNGKKTNNGIIIFVEYKHTNLEILEAKSKFYATPDQPIILYSKDEKKCLSPSFGYKGITYEETSTEKFLDGFIDNDMVWKGFNADDYRLLAGQKLEEPEKYKHQFYIGIIVFIIFLTLATVFFFRNIASQNGIHISIRYKLIFIFALAVYMPALSLWVLSHTSLHDHRTAIENNIKKGMLDVLIEIDTGYTASIEESNEAYRKLDKYFESFSGKPAPSSAEVRNKLAEIAGKDKTITDVFNWLDVRKIDLHQVYTTSSSESNKRLEPIGRVLTLIGLNKYCPERLVKNKVPQTPSDILVGDFMVNPVIGFSSIFERPGEMVFQNFEGSCIYWHWNYFADDNNPIAAYIGNSALRYMTMTYFRSVLKKRYTFENTNLQLINYHSNVVEFIPETAYKYHDLTALIEVSKMNQTIETAIVKYLDSNYYCICMPGNNMQECFLLCLYPLAEIDYKIQKVRSTIYTVMIILLVISIFTGLLLAKTFIIPVNELNRGLTALRKRETETTIKIENKDELGQLGTAFNQMMSDIKDMLIAGAVQQCLIPTGKFEIEGYDCRVYNQMATDVGGDYADIFELPDDRTLIVIGDVTGHGVSSALLTAMVKASIFRFAHKDTPLNEIVTKTSDMIFDLLNKKKLMTFCAIVIDKKSGDMAICNAGHPYPMIHSGKGNLRALSVTGLPLGVSKKRCRYNAIDEHISPGETLFLYTDGFPEAEDANGNEYGYSTFQELITNQNIDSAESLENVLKSEFIRHHGNAELTDDVTFIILKRFNA